MDNRITLLLEAYGLDAKEIKVYLELIGKKELNAYNLAKITGVHRSTVYDVLERLVAKGFVSKVQKGDKSFYSALEIGQTIAKIKDKESILLSLIPEFEKIKEKGVSNVRVLESRESQKQFNFNLFNQLKNEKVKELYILSGGPTGALDIESQPKEDLSSRIFLERLLKEMKSEKLHKKLDYKGIWDTKFKGSKILELFSGLGQNRFLKGLPTLATTVIFGEYIAYLFTMDDTPQVIEIQNKFIADENKAYFHFLWKISNK